MADHTFLVEFDPTGRMGAACPNEQMFVTVSTDYGESHILNAGRTQLINGLRKIASAFINMDIEFLDVYHKIN